MNEMIIDTIGWLGAVLVLYAYFMVSVKKLAGDSLHFQAANISGAFCLVINTYYHHAYPSAVVNIIWIGIALFALKTKKVL